MEHKPAPTVIDKILVVLGVVTRCTFFAGCYSALVVYSDTTDWPGFTTKFGDLTVSLLADSTTKAMFLLAIGVLITTWAFGNGKKDYRAWAKFGGYAVCTLVGVYAIWH